MRKLRLKFGVPSKIMIYGDSNMVCNMVSKKWGWNKKKTAWIPHKNAPHLKQLLYKAVGLLEKLDYGIEWIPRKKNQEADNFSKEPLIKAGIIKPEIELKKEPCSKCAGYLIKRKGKFGEFYGCSNYPECTFTKRIEN